MQTQETDQISEDILNSYEYQVIQKSIEDLSSVLLIIQDGISDEIQQAISFKKMIDVQERLLLDSQCQSVVSIEYLTKIRKDLETLKFANHQKTENIRNLNRYLNDRIRQMKKLQQKRLDLIKSMTPASVLEFRTKK